MYGGGSAVVLLHGAPSSPDDFIPLVERLARRGKIFVPHMPGYGRSGPAARPYVLEQVIADLEDRLVHLGVSRAVVLAFSAGAYKAVSIALRRRIAISRMVLCAPVIGLDASVAQGYREMLAGVQAGTFDPRASWLDRMASPGFKTRDPAGAARVLAWLDAAPDAVISDELLALADAPDLRPRLSELTFPILIGTGAEDNAVPAAWSEEIARLAPDGRFHRVSGAGHAVLIERPEEAIRMVERFLDEPIRKES
jgi:3-oxoadipate enol-lactonase